MYYVEKRLEISAAHRLELDYESKCTNIHGHNWIVTIYCKARELNDAGMVTDFTEIKKKVQQEKEKNNAKLLYYNNCNSFSHFVRNRHINCCK